MQNSKRTAYFVLVVPFWNIEQQSLKYHAHAEAPLPRPLPPPVASCCAIRLSLVKHVARLCGLGKRQRLSVELQVWGGSEQRVSGQQD